MKSLNLSKTEELQIQYVLGELMESRPIQYIFNKAHFYGRDLFVNESVLIPRRETEELVNLIIKKVGASNRSILDIGTGSGCIPITLGKELENIQLHAVEISKEAMSIAKRNAKQFQVQGSLVP